MSIVAYCKGLIARQLSAAAGPMRPCVIWKGVGAARRPKSGSPPHCGHSTSLLAPPKSFQAYQAAHTSPTRPAPHQPAPSRCHTAPPPATCHACLAPGPDRQPAGRGGLRLGRCDHCRRRRLSAARLTALATPPACPCPLPRPALRFKDLHLPWELHSRLFPPLTAPPPLPPPDLARSSRRRWRRLC